jgi:hypothetical protein
MRLLTKLWLGDLAKNSGIGLQVHRACTWVFESSKDILGHELKVGWGLSAENIECAKLINQGPTTLHDLPEHRMRYL